MEISNVGIGLAFIAGLASFLSPCVFSLVPAYIGYLGGRSVSSNSLNGLHKWHTFFHGFAFVLGFSFVFVLLGAAASALGGVLYTLKPWIAKMGGIIVVIFGLHMTGILRLRIMEYDLRRQAPLDWKWGYLTSAMMGIFFSAGWSPCVGPVLGTILTLALNGGSISKGIYLLSAYSLGLAIPFLIAALGIGWVTTILSRYGKVMRYIEIMMGILLIIVGIMLILGIFEQISRFGFFINLGI
jgi:cytochrome c-type biogenesis protein